MEIVAGAAGGRSLGEQHFGLEIFVSETMGALRLTHSHIDSDDCSFELLLCFVWGSYRWIVLEKL